MLELKNITKHYGSHVVFSGVCLSGQRGDIIRISGPSGAGKTTLLMCIAGLEKFESGEIIIDGQTVQSDKVFLPPNRRKTAMVFQDLALWPHMSVWQNIDFVSSSIIRNKHERFSWNEELLKKFHIGQKKNSFPSELSGGEQQRVALARSLANKPGILLLDESFSNLDSALADEIIGETVDHCKTNRILLLIVTHSESNLHNYPVISCRLSNGILKKEN